jgi:flagellin-like protein
MLSRARHRRARRGVANIVAASMMIGITVIAGTALWSLQFNFPTSGMSMNYIADAGLKIPAWGDPTDCTPYGYPTAPASSWSWAEWGAYWYYCVSHQIGNFSMMNASSITITSISPSNIPLSKIDFYFICDNSTRGGNTTLLVAGNLAAMTWFPGSSSHAAPNAPHLGWCSNFNANGFGGGAFGTLYNRLGIFVPIRQGDSVAEPGDTFILYVHTPGSVYDPQYNGADRDDYHGAPAWCFTVPGACEIKFVYTGNPSTTLATIPIYSISGAGQ